MSDNLSTLMARTPPNGRRPLLKLQLEILSLTASVNGFPDTHRLLNIVSDVVGRGEEAALLRLILGNEKS